MGATFHPRFNGSDLLVSSLALSWRNSYHLVFGYSAPSIEQVQDNAKFVVDRGDYFREEGGCRLAFRCGLLVNADTLWDDVSAVAGVRGGSWNWK